MDKYRIDSHKLIYHPKRVLDWFEGRDIYPIYIEIAPYGGCNHRCIFCALDYLGYKPVKIDTKTLKKFIDDIASKGVKSVMFAGEGEPLLNKDLPGLVRYTKEKGIDVAITTNGVLLSKDISEKILPYLSWLRISFNAGTARTYSYVHGTDPEDFETVIKNLKEAVRIKNKWGCPSTIGAQFLLLNENYKEATLLAGILKKIGADYLIVKPYSQHPLSINKLKITLDYKKLLFIEKRLDEYIGGGFDIIFRKNTMLKIVSEKPYKKCLGLPFWAYLAANGDLYACSSFLGDKRFCYGNIYQKSFDKIWKGQKRKTIAYMIKYKWDITNCREVCRLDEINRYLWELRNPSEHVNFI